MGEHAPFGERERFVVVAQLLRRHAIDQLGQQQDPVGQVHLVEQLPGFGNMGFRSSIFLAGCGNSRATTIIPSRRVDDSTTVKAGKQCPSWIDTFRARSSNMPSPSRSTWPSPIGSGRRRAARSAPRSMPPRAASRGRGSTAASFRCPAAISRSSAPNGVIDFDARYLLEADDGAIIYLQNRGYRWARSPEIAERMARNEPVGPDDYYMRVSPQFDAPRRPARLDGEARLRRRRREDPEGQPHPLFRGALNWRGRCASRRSCGPASTPRARRTSRRCRRPTTTVATSTAWSIERNLAIPLRDGTVIYADLYRPEGAAGEADLPLLLAWGPYGKHALSNQVFWPRSGVEPGLAVAADAVRGTGPGLLVSARLCRRGRRSARRLAVGRRLPP